MNTESENENGADNHATVSNKAIKCFAAAGLVKDQKNSCARREKKKKKTLYP